MSEVALPQNQSHDHGHEHAGHEHPSYLAHHFDTPVQQFDSGKLGMWLFLNTEVLLFGGLFCAYSIYRSIHPEIFQYAHLYLNKTLGGINTAVLIVSSLTMAWAVRCAQLNQRKGLITCLVLTLLCAAGFLGIKYMEYKVKFQHQTLWGVRYNPQEPPEGAIITNAPAASALPAAAPASAPALNAEGYLAAQSAIAPAAPGGTALAADYLHTSKATGEKEHYVGPEPNNVQIFFGIYFVMTGLHGLHVLAGMAVITWILIRSIRGDFNSQYYNPVDFVALYWHVVDLVWIFLFPLLYLIGNSGPS